MAIHIDEDGNFFFGQAGTQALDEINYTPVFSVTNAGVLTATSGTVGGWTLGSTTLTATDNSSNSITLNSNGTISANYSQASTGYQLNADGSAEFNGPILHLGNTVSGTPGEFSGKRLNIGNSFIFDLGSQGLTISSTAVRASKFKAIAVGSASNPPIAIAGDHAELGFFATNTTDAGGFTTMHATNGTSDVFHWSSAGTNVTFHGNVTIEGSQLSVNNDTGGNNKFLGYNSSGTLGFHSVSTGSHNHDSDYSATSHDHNSTYYTETEVNNLLANKDNYNYWRLREDGNNVGVVSSTESVNFIGGSGVTVSNSGSGGDYNITISASGTAHTHSSVLSFSANEINIFGSVKPSSNNNRSIGTSSSLRFADMYSTEFHGGTFYGTLVNSSSQNTKTNIEDTGLGLDFIEALPVKQFNYITADHSEKKYTGVIAEDVQVILDNNGWDDYYLVVDDSDSYRYKNRCQHPAICTNEELENFLEGNYTCQETCCEDYFKFTEEDGTVTNWIHDTVEECEAYEVDGNRHPHFNYYQLIGPLVKAVQELSTQISDLTARVEELEG